ncbi:hypothetical protein [Niabella beijingensis]|uniref:hypothetical protein n=1 Tax=Niabella beijingensis TaxID=2872700 RepID=UPI001CC10015|nr:hypothetical protein [Niabella beijingensis]MBZ4190035.1 hypothetical protein [Niabella beijingensis]
MKQEPSYNILTGIRKQQDPQADFTLPEHYFETLEDRLKTAIRQSENTTEDPLLPETVSREMPYAVPGYYFEQFRVNRGRLIPFKKGLAIAASFILLAVTSIFLFTKKPLPGETASLPVTTAVDQLSNEQLERFIQPEDATLKEKILPQQPAATNGADMTILFKNVPDAELARFLNETAEGNDELFLN